MISIRGVWTDIDMWRLDWYRYVEVGLVSICGDWTDVDVWRLD